MQLLTDHIYLVKHKTNGTFYMDVKETNETWTKGRLIRRKADDPKGSCFFSVNDQVKIDNSLCAFELIKVPKEDENEFYMHFRTDWP